MRYIDSDEYDDKFDETEEEESDMLPCPYCGKEIYGDADVCPYCGSFIVEEDRHAPRPMWIVWTALIALAAFLTVFVLKI